MFDFLAQASPVAQTVLFLSLTVAIGLAVGRIAYKGAALGVGGVLFAGLFVGDLAQRHGLALDLHVLEFLREFGLILFVYTIGVTVGPGFFEALRRVGARLNALAALVVLLGAVTTVALQKLLDLPLAAALGVFSGAVTNTPALGATQQALADLHLPPGQLALPGLGYAVAYPFGIVGILLTMVLIRVVFRIDPARVAAEFEEKRRAEAGALAVRDVVVEDARWHGQMLRRLPGIETGEFTVSRLMRAGALQVPHDVTRVEQGDILHLVGRPEALDRFGPEIGRESDTTLTTKNTGLTWDRLIVTHEQALGKRLSALDVEGACDVRISRVDRAGVEIVAHPGVKLQFGDVLNVVGRPADITRAAEILGNSQARLKHFDPLPMFIGVAIGVVLGSFAVSVPGLAAPIKLGLAGGPLLAAIALSRVGSIGPLLWFTPPGAVAALRELGITLFLAVVGFTSGGRFVETLTSGQGWRWMAVGAVITLVPLVVVALIGHLVMRLDYLRLCGLLAGSTTDPPALAFANAMAPDSQAQAQAYAAVYPLVMALRILTPQIIAFAMM
jgi:putative transport protein